MGSDVRCASLGDARQVARVQVLSWRAGYRGLLPADHLASLSVADAERTWRTRIATGSGLLVAPGEGAVRGFVSFGDALDDGARSTGQVYALYVLPESWRAGLGRALLGAAIQRLAARGHDAAVLWVLAGNTAARAFYERLGWWADGAEQTEVLAEGVHLLEVCYRRDLPPA